jgi:hypothetical protein
MTVPHRRRANEMAHWLNRHAKDLDHLCGKLAKLAADAPPGTTSIMADTLTPGVDLDRLRLSVQSLAGVWRDKARRVQHYEQQLVQERGPAS